jgi:hypothetical protein
VDVETCTKVQDKKWQGQTLVGLEKTLAVAWESKITHTVSIETIEYDPSQTTEQDSVTARVARHGYRSEGLLAA